MKKLFLFGFLFIVLFTIVAGSLYVRDELRTPFPDKASIVILEIPRGLRARDVVGLLEERNVIRSRYATLAYIFYSGQRHRLQAGEYQFDRPMTPVEVVARLVSGDVLLHKFTVPEGLTLEETASKWEEQSYGRAEDFEKAARDSLGLIKEFDPNAPSLEGYLFPETYSFPSKTTPRQVIESMVSRFRNNLQRLETEIPRNQWPQDVRSTVILASLVESEAAREEDRPLVASVYLNRIRRNMLLQCDPTVIYALEKADRYNGRLTRADLKFPSPYNTYVSAGLPPGPIMNPGYPSLRAAVQPAVTPHLYFVRSADGRHTFTDNLAAHNRAVAVYRAMQRRK